MKSKEEQTYFRPGDVVELKQKKELCYSPIMYVIGNEEKRFSDNLKGIRCRWFSRELNVCEAIFSTKDLVLVKSFNNK